MALADQLARAFPGAENTTTHSMKSIVSSFRIAAFAAAASAIFTTQAAADVVVYHQKTTTTKVGSLFESYDENPDTGEWTATYAPGISKHSYNSVLVIDKESGEGYTIDVWSSKVDGKMVKYYYVYDYVYGSIVSLDGGKKEYESYEQALGVKSTLNIAGVKVLLAKNMSGSSSFTMWNESDEETGEPLPEFGAVHQTELIKLTLDAPLTVKVWEKSLGDALDEVLAALEKKGHVDFED